MGRMQVQCCLAVIVLLVSAMGAGAAQRPAQQSTSAGVNQVLQAIERSSTLAQISEAAKAAKLSPEDFRQLEAQVRKGPAMQKLEKLRAQALMAALTAQRETKPDALQLLRDKRLALEKSRADQIKRSDQSLIGLRPTRTTAAQPEPRATVSNATIVASMAASGSSADIGGCTDPVIGQDMTIRGRGFTESQGRVAMVVRRQLFYCPVKSWHDGSIVCTVTDELEPALGTRPTVSPPSCG